MGSRDGIRGAEFRDLAPVGVGAVMRTRPDEARWVSVSVMFNGPDPWALGFGSVMTL